MTDGDFDLLTQALSDLEWARIMLNLDGDKSGDYLIETINQVRTRLELPTI